MELKENNYEIEIPEESIKPFEEKVLLSGLCDFIIPMSFSSYGGKRKITYECSGYASIKELKISKVRDVFEILEKTLISLNKSTEFLLDPHKITLTPETVYYNLKQKDVKIAYIPSENKSKSLNDSISFYIDRLSEGVTEEAFKYLASIKENMKKGHHSIKELITKVGEMRREIYLCGIE